MKIDNIEWMGKRGFTQKARQTGETDVTITESITSENEHKARFTFRNGVANIVSETDYIQYGIKKEKKTVRIYFKTGDKNTGLKLSAPSSNVNDNKYVTINRVSDAEKIIPFAGDYELLHDQECGLYYIQK